MIGVLIFAALGITACAYLRAGTAARACAPVSGAMLAIDAHHAAKANGLAT